MITHPISYPPRPIPSHPVPSRPIPSRPILPVPDPPPVSLPPTRKEVQLLGIVPPHEFAATLRRFTFMLGLGDPLASPSPLEALANGVSFLNPRSLADDPRAARHPTQHPPLASLGAPYTYSYHIDEPATAVAAARLAARWRFDSFIPYEMTRSATVLRFCTSVIEDVAPCMCASAHASASARASESDAGTAESSAGALVGALCRAGRMRLSDLNADGVQKVAWDRRR